MAQTDTSPSLGHIAPRSRGLQVHTVTSSDGTAIAYERSGDGPPVVVVGGGLNEKATFATLSELLSEKLTVFNYDRRGRGHSGDGDRASYTVDLEIDDLAAVIEAVGEPTFVFANCTGGMIAVLAAARGVPMRKLAMYEPPYADSSERAPLPADYMDRLEELIRTGHHDEAILLFQKESVGNTDEFISWFRKHPAFPSFAALAPTLIYDGIIGNEGSIPFAELPKITAPALVIDGGASPEWQRNACEMLARSLPRARHVRMDGEGHIMNKQKIAPILTDFFLS